MTNITIMTRKQTIKMIDFEINKKIDFLKKQIEQLNVKIIDLEKIMSKDKIWK